MKTFVKIVLSSFIFANSFAAPNYSSGYIPIIIQKDGGSNVTFTLPNQKVESFVPGEVYFFSDGENEYQGTYTGLNENGLPHWNSFEKTPRGEGSDSHVYSGPSSSDNKKSSPSELGPGSSDGYLNSGAHKQAMNSATTTGVAHAIYNGIIFTPDFKAEMARIQAETVKNQAETEVNYETIRKNVVQAQENYQKAIATFQKSLSDLSQSGASNLYSIEFKSNDTALVQELKELETIFRASRTFTEKGQESRRYGLEMIRHSDLSSASGDPEAAHAFKQYAEAFADIVVGLDPVTGPIRDVYEAFTGKNLITGKKLDSIERTFAVLGAVSFGFGSKLSRGIKAITKVFNSRNVEAIIHAERVAIHAEERLGAKGRAQYHKYLQELRRDMERPHFQDPDLAEFMTWFWREKGKIGNGSTMAAIRWERMTGEKVGGRVHSQKGWDAITHLSDWLKSHPNASTSDRRAVENIILDILDALKGDI